MIKCVYFILSTYLQCIDENVWIYFIDGIVARETRTAKFQSNPELIVNIRATSLSLSAFDSHRTDEPSKVQNVVQYTISHARVRISCVVSFPNVLTGCRLKSSRVFRNVLFCNQPIHLKKLIVRQMK